MSWDLTGLPSREPEPQRLAAALPPTGSRVGPFEVLGELARGGIGAVLRVREVETGRELALKLLLAADLTPARRERFLREGQVAASLDHPGIVKVHACGEHEGRPWLAWALIEGGRTLEEELPRRELAGRVALVRDAARALGHAHGRGVIHRDVKPRNVLVDGAGNVRVADFGLAWADGPERLTRTGELLGTPTHMAPEQIVSAKGSESPRLDVWALGVILYQALTGELPFQGQSLLEVMAAVTRGKPTAPRELVPGLSPGLEAVCLRALERDPARRYPDGEALATDLDLVLAGRPPAGPRRPGRARVLVGAIGLLLLLVLLLGSALLGPEARQDPAPSLPGDPAQTGDGVADVDSLLLAGRFAEARASSGGRRQRGLCALLAGDLDAARADLRAPQDVLAVDLERDRLALAARYARIGKQDVPLPGSIRQEAQALLGLAQRSLAVSTDLPAQLLGERVLSTLCLLTAVQTALFDKDGEQREHAALLERALRSLPARAEAAREVNLLRSWAMWAAHGKSAPAELVPEPGEWLRALPRTPWLDPEFVAHGLWFVCAAPDQLEARLDSGELALARGPENGTDPLQLLRDVLARLSRVERRRAHAAFARGDRAAGEAFRQRALERARAAVVAVPGDPPDAWDHAQLVLAHLLGRELDAARATLKGMEDGAVRRILLAECELIGGDLPAAQGLLDGVILTDDRWVEARLARAHAHDLLREVKERRADVARARELAVDPRAAPPLGIDWHEPGRMRALFDHEWWPGERQR